MEWHVTDTRMPAFTESSIILNSLRVLYEDNHLLVVDKPAGVATMGTEPGTATVARHAASYLKHKYHKPGNVFVGVVSRLDSLVSGVLVLARTSKAASRLSEQIRARTVKKRYLALVEGRLEMPSQVESRQGDSSARPQNPWLEIEDWVRKDESMQRMAIASASSPGGQLARLRLRQLASNGTLTLVEIDLITGRKHQIRLQLSAAGNAVLGDRKYGARRKFSPGIALHCHQVAITHPTRKEDLTFTSQPGQDWYRAAPMLMEQGLALVNHPPRD